MWRRKISFWEGKTEKENIWRGKYLICKEEEQIRKRSRILFGEGKLKATLINQPIDQLGENSASAFSKVRK